MLCCSTKGSGGSRIRRLEPRLAVLREWSHAYRRIADIGAHHGRLARALAQDGKQVVATEISSGGLHELAQHLAGLQIDVRQGDGLEPVVDESLDLVVIAGMGSDTVMEILSQRHRMASRPHFALQPVQGLLAVHRTIAVEGWQILKAGLVTYRRRYYPMWLVNVYDAPIGKASDEALFLPREFRPSPHYREWLTGEIGRRQVQRPTKRSQQEMAWLTDELTYIESHTGKRRY